MGPDAGASALSRRVADARGRSLCGSSVGTLRILRHRRPTRSLPCRRRCLPTGRLPSTWLWIRRRVAGHPSRAAQRVHLDAPEEQGALHDPAETARHPAVLLLRPSPRSVALAALSSMFLRARRSIMSESPAVEERALESGAELTRTYAETLHLLGALAIKSPRARVHYRVGVLAHPRAEARALRRTRRSRVVHGGRAGRSCGSPRAPARRRLRHHVSIILRYSPVPDAPGVATASDHAARRRAAAARRLHEAAFRLLRCWSALRGSRADDARPLPASRRTRDPTARCAMLTVRLSRILRGTMIALFPESSLRPRLARSATPPSSARLGDVAFSMMRRLRVRAPCAPLLPGLLARRRSSAGTTRARPHERVLTLREAPATPPAPYRRRRRPAPPTPREQVGRGHRDPQRSQHGFVTHSSRARARPRRGPHFDR